MAFVPKIDFCAEKNINGDYELIVTDITDIYDATDNPTGWQNALTLLPANVTALTITIKYTDSDGNIVTTVNNVLSELLNPMTGTLEFNPFPFQGDGSYFITYTVTTASTTYKACKQKIIYPEVSCCIAKKLLKLTEDLSKTNLIDQINQLKAFEKVLIHSCSSIDETTALKVLNSMEKLCAADCGCGC